MNHKQSGAIHLLGILLIAGVIMLVMGTGSKSSSNKPVAPPVQQGTIVDSQYEQLPGQSGATQDKAFIEYCLKLAEKGIKSDACEYFFAKKAK